MRRRFILLALLVASALGVLAVWLVDHLERVPVTLREAPQAEARRNPYLALERFTTRMGGQLTRQSDARILDRLPAGGSLFLDRQRAHLLPPERLRHLLDWVAQGGWLIAVAELPPLADPLLDSLGVRRLPPPDAKHGEYRSIIEVLLPGQSRPLRVDASTQLLAADERQPLWSAGQGERGQQILHFRIGRGRLTVASELDQQLSNRHIGQQDHAELYWRLISRDDPSVQPRVLLLSRLQMPTLFEWLWENAWTTCLAVAVLIAVWLWMIVPRFGSVRPEPLATRRELRQHLAAIAHYLWRTGQLSALLPAAREHFRRHLAQRQPDLAARPLAAQASALTVLSGLPAARIASALAGRADHPQAFTDALRVLRELERLL